MREHLRRNNLELTRRFFDRKKASRYLPYESTKACRPMGHGQIPRRGRVNFTGNFLKLLKSIETDRVRNTHKMGPTLSQQRNSLIQNNYSKKKIKWRFPLRHVAIITIPKRKQRKAHSNPT